MLTAGELKEFLKDIPDRTEVRLETEYSEALDRGIHHECTDIMYSDDYSEKFVIIVPDEQELIDRQTKV